MKFKVESEIEILDEELLEIINDRREWDELELYNSVDEIPKSDILDWIDSNEEYFVEEIVNYDNKLKITIL